MLTTVSSDASVEVVTSNKPGATVSKKSKTLDERHVFASSDSRTSDGGQIHSLELELASASSSRSVRGLVSALYSSCSAGTKPNCKVRDRETGAKQIDLRVRMWKLPKERVQ